jgi:hypothetical protein
LKLSPAVGAARMVWPKKTAVKMVTMVVNCILDVGFEGVLVLFERSVDLLLLVVVLVDC